MGAAPRNDHRCFSKSLDCVFSIRGICWIGARNVSKAAKPSIPGGAFVANMKNLGVPIYAVSAGNEPHSNANGAVYYSAADMASWVGVSEHQRQWRPTGRKQGQAE